MRIAGIVAEYNPFHPGHAYQIRQTRAQLDPDAGIVAVMSGNWVQQANCAVADKWRRTRLALMGGADLVLELPTVWATASAEGFARGAVSILHACGVAETLSFGSEHGDPRPLAQIAQCLDSPEYQSCLRPLVERGLPFAVCRQAAVAQLLGEDLSALLSAPNNNLGIEYIRALNALGSPIRPITVLRQGAAHNSIREDAPDFLSATQIRRDLFSGDLTHAQPYLISGAQHILLDDPLGLAHLSRAERAILARVRTMTEKDWAALPDSGQSEGLPHRLEKAGARCTSLEEFYNLTKTKRYTHARLRRLVLWAYLGLNARDIPNTPPYIRVLGFNRRGQEILKGMKQSAALPLVTKPAHARTLSEEGRRLFELEARFTDLYDLCLPQIPQPGREWSQGPILLSVQ